MSLQLNPNFREPGRRNLRDYAAGDQFYEELIDAHRGLSDEESLQVNARLILLLSNHIGDLAVLRQALALARSDAQAGAGQGAPTGAALPKPGA